MPGSNHPFFGIVCKNGYALPFYTMWTDGNCPGLAGMKPEVLDGILGNPLARKATTEGYRWQNLGSKGCKIEGKKGLVQKCH